MLDEVFNHIETNFNCRTLESFKASELFWGDNFMVGNIRYFVERNQRCRMDCYCLADIYNFDHPLPLRHSSARACVG